jgi:protein pelota
MRVSKRDLKTGFIAVHAESLDDLWYLSQIIKDGDLVSARTVRLVKGKEDNLRSGKGEKKAMTLAVRAEKAEFDENANKLRILGKIESGPEEYIALGSHHTLELSEHDRLDIRKSSWSESEIGYIRDAEKAAKRAKVMICIVGDGEATVALVRDRGPYYMDTRENLGGKYTEGREKNKKEFYGKLLALLLEESGKGSIQNVIIGGPGFEKRNFMDYAKGKLNAQVADTGNEGRQGVHEILKGGSLERVLGDARIAREARLVERLQQEISKDGIASYGRKDVENAVNSGAVETLLVLDKLLREEWAESLIRKAKASGADFHVLNSKFEPGQRLEGLGEIAALLRYKV